ncbi:coiled-coil domain-containing protein 40-like isoform X1 [Argiope bruennichi]|uniref:coiled-coil domain-containing protein 40-like isoform X1 n=2 Tax=Argiope bruennichi TaxID=94029 RepID=UPI0024948865|nr:coiled-coil domain-containing protein 40-like isoform X1 [Argiope bruennichi]
MSSASSNEEEIVNVSEMTGYPSIPESGDFKEHSPMETTKVTMHENRDEKSHRVLDSSHPLMLKYQKDLNERLLNLLHETEEHIVDLKRAVTGQENENKHFAERGYELQKELKSQEDKLKSIHEKYEIQIKLKEKVEETRETIKKNFEDTEKAWQDELKRDIELQTKLEDVAFEVIQVTSLQMEQYREAKTAKRAVEKTSKDRENLEIEKLRQDLLISRLENDKFNLEDKINRYKTQWSIKKEEATDLRKELIAANSEMEVIHLERQQIVHQWRQSLASLEKQDRVLAEIRDSVRKFEDDASTLNMDISACKKSVRKELERNEHLVFQLQFRESDISRSQKELGEVLEKHNDLEENISVMDRTVEMTEQELKVLNDNKMLLEKENDIKDRELQKAYGYQKSLEKKHMDMLHDKMTITKASKYTEKLIKDIRNSIRSNEDKGSKKENEKEKLLLKLDNLRTYLSNMESNLNDLQKERRERAILKDKSEMNVLKTREKLDVKRGEVRELENQLKEMINQAGGQELAPFERELASLRREITTAEQGKRNMEQEYLRCQQELFSLSKQSAVKSDENEFYQKKIAVVEAKKLQLEADISKEEKDMKEIQNRIQRTKDEIAHVNKILRERNEVQDNVLQMIALSKSDYIKTLKEAEMNYLQKQNELKLLRRKKKKHFRKLIEAQRHIVYWEGKVRLAEDTRKILKSASHRFEFSSINSEIRCLRMKLEHVKKEQEDLVQEMKRAVYTHTSLYIEADKQSLFGKRRKTPEFIHKKIKHAQRKIQEDKKDLEKLNQRISSLRSSEAELSEAYESEHEFASGMISKIKAMEYDIENKEQEKRQAVIELSFKQKRTKLMQKVLDGTYIRAIRNEECREDEIQKLQAHLRSVEVIVQTAMNEYPHLEKTWNKIIDYITVSKEI